MTLQNSRFEDRGILLITTYITTDICPPDSEISLIAFTFSRKGEAAIQKDKRSYVLARQGAARPVAGMPATGRELILNISLPRHLSGLGLDGGDGNGVDNIRDSASPA